IGFACKKSSTSTTTTSTTTSSSTTSSTSSTTGSTTSTNTTTTNFKVDGTAAVNPTASGQVSGTNYVVTAVDGNNGTPTVQITFNGTSAPANGSYPIMAGTSPTAGKCGFLMTNINGYEAASTGTVTIVGKDAQFTNILCNTGNSGATHTVTGNIIWP